MKNKENVRGWLLEKRKAMGMTQEQVAEAAGIARSYYTRIENGDHKVPVATAKQVAQVLDLDWTQFYS